MHKTKELLRTTDVLLFALCAALSTVSVLTLNALNTVRGNEGADVHVQLAACLAGLVLALVLSCLDYHLTAKYWLVHVALTWGLVLLTLLRVGPFGIAPAGTDNFSWIRMPFGMSLQPAEFAKISFIITLAMHLQAVRKELNKPKNLLLLLVHIAVPVLLIHLQGDDGSALVFAAIGFVMLFAAGLSRIILACILAGGVGGAVFLWVGGYFKSYQMRRIAALLDAQNPEYVDILYQQAQGRAALANGGVLGTGLFSSEHIYVPLQQNDFIFTYIGESLGFIGAMALVLVLLGVAARLLVNARRAEDLFGALLCVGVFSVFTWQSVVNLGMNLMLLPVIGVTLPLVSAGGTSTLSLYLCIGLAAAVYRRSARQRSGGLRTQ